MKKDKAVRKAEMKKSLINACKSLIVPVIGILVIVLVVLFVKHMEKPDEQEKIIEMKAYSGDESDIVLENDKLVMTMDPITTQFQVKVKDTGAVWYSNPQDVDSDPLALTLEKQKLQSTLILYYSTQNGVDTLFNNYEYSISKGIYDIEKGDDYIKVFYSIGDKEKEFMIPTVIEKSRMEAFLEKMDKDSATRTKDYYKKYDINKLGKKDNKEELLAAYPQLENEVLYILRDTTKDNIKTKLAEYFEAAGYTAEEYEEDKLLAGGESSSDKPVFNVNVVYKLEGDRLVVDVPLEEIEYKEKYPIYNLCVLPYFGAGSTEEDGYLFVPEGGGAKIRFNNGKVAQNSYYSDLYGWDRAQNRDAVVHETNTYFNAFGVAKEDNAFLCVIDEGAPYAGIMADISGRSNSYNYVYPQYSIIHREKYEVGSRYEGAIFMYEKSIPKENLVQKYCFVNSSGDGDLAKTYQNYLVEKSGDDFQKVEDTSTPVAVEIVGAVDKIVQVCGVPTSRPLELTSYKEAQQIMVDLQNDGMDNLSVKMSGWMNHGVQQRVLNDVDLVGALGGKKDFKNLTNYAKSNNIDLYLNGITDYAYDSDVFDGFFVFTDAARYVNNQKAEIFPYSTVTYAAREKQEPHYLLRPEEITKTVSELNKACDKYQANISFEEIGEELNADYRKKGVTTRQTVMNKEVEQLKDIQASGKKIMINMGNNYAVPYVDMITNMDLNGSTYSIIDEYVPVYQMAIHGYVNYTGESLNLAQNYEEELLTSVEYGAGLSFTLMDETAFTLQNTLYTQYFGAEYDAVHTKMIETYNRFNEDLGHTFNQKIVNHTSISNTLKCTEYEDGTKAYVNYGYDPVTSPENIEIPARDFLVIK